jgi:hypothetical protein
MLCPRPTPLNRRPNVPNLPDRIYPTFTRGTLPRSGFVPRPNLELRLWPLRAHQRHSIATGRFSKADIPLTTLATSRAGILEPLAMGWTAVRSHCGKSSASKVPTPSPQEITKQQ